MKLKTAIYVNEHGGECCGRYHIFGFDTGYPVNSYIYDVKQILDDLNAGMAREESELGDEEELKFMCAEITLTQFQLGKTDSKGITLLSRLKELGFEVVYKFVNPNSLNTVYVLLYSANKED